MGYQPNPNQVALDKSHERARIVRRKKAMAKIRRGTTRSVVVIPSLS